MKSDAPPNDSRTTEPKQSNPRTERMITLRTPKPENPQRTLAVLLLRTTMWALVYLFVVNVPALSGDGQQGQEEGTPNTITRSAAGMTIESLDIDKPDLSIDGANKNETGEQTDEPDKEEGTSNSEQNRKRNKKEEPASAEQQSPEETERPVQTDWYDDPDPYPEVRTIILDPVPDPEQVDHLLDPADMRRRLMLKLLFEYRLWKVNERMDLYKFDKAFDQAKALHDRLSGTFLEPKARTVLRRVQRPAGEMYRSVRDIAQPYVDREQYKKARELYSRYIHMLMGVQPWEQLIDRDRGRIVLHDEADWIRKQKRKSRRTSRRMQQRYQRKRRRQKREWREQLREERRLEFINDTELVADFPSGNNYSSSQKPVEIIRKGPEHFRVRMKRNGREGIGWFLLAFDGFPDRPRRVRVDLVDVPDKWHSVNPLVSAPGVEDLSDPANFRFQPRKRPFELEEARNGSMLPPTDGQKWRYMQDVRWKPDESTLTTYARVQGERTYFTMRTPYTSDLNEAVMEQLSEVGKHVRVHEVGTSQKEHPLYIAQVGGTMGDAASKQPCVVLVCQEHADEHSTGQFGFQTLHALLRLRKSNKAVRNTTFLVIPQLDPMGTDRNYYSRIARKFDDDTSRATQKAFVSWFRDWANAGNRLTMVINMHHIEGGERDINFFPGYLPGGSRHRHTQPFLSTFVRRMKKAGYSATADGEVGGMIHRLGGFLDVYMGSPHMLLELNTHAKSRHLNLQDLYLMGGMMVRTVASYLHRNSVELRKLHQYVLKHRRKRRQLLERYGHLSSTEWFREQTPIGREGLLRALPTFERSELEEHESGEDFQKDWMRQLYEKEGISPSNAPDPDEE